MEISTGIHSPRPTHSHLHVSVTIGEFFASRNVYTYQNVSNLGHVNVCYSQDLYLFVLLKTECMDVFKNIRMIYSWSSISGYVFVVPFFTMIT
jgi:hypothetical protein